MTEEEIIKKVEERVSKELENEIDSENFGYINIFENRKKEILKNEYGIEIKTKSEQSNCECID